MAGYKRERARVDAAIRKAGVVVVMNRDHVKTAGDLVTTMWEVCQAGYVAECTFRIDEGLIREAMQELTKKRAEAPADKPFLLGVGSIINPKELESALGLGFDMIVAPANVMGGYGEGKEFVRLCREVGVFSAPAILSPTERHRRPAGAIRAGSASGPHHHADGRGELRDRAEVSGEHHQARVLPRARHVQPAGAGG
jgi:2-keto-3-deoxy-6-phosphogluconate aldolase